jgi:hypothetical protein
VRSSLDFGHDRTSLVDAASSRLQNTHVVTPSCIGGRTVLYAGGVNRRILLLGAVIVGLVGVVWLTVGKGMRSRKVEQMPTAAEEKEKPGSGPAPASGPGPAALAPNQAPAPPAPPQALQRNAEVRGKITAVLDKYPDVASLRTVDCQPTGACRIEVQVEDLDNFRAPLELLQDPEGGLSGDHALMILSKPVPLGPKGGAPYLFTFQLTPPEGGVVTPSSPPRPTP